MNPSQAFTSYSLYMWLLLVALFCSSVLLVDGEELTSVKDAIFATKTNDVMAVGLFESKNDPGYEEFKAASDTFQGKEAMKMTYSFTKEVLERYQEETQGRLPALIVFRNFDEDGKTKRGKRVKVIFEEDETGFGRLSLVKFLFKAALPPVLAMPASGPDAQNRLNLGMRSNYPKMFVFTKEREVGEAVLATAKKFNDRMVSFLVTVDDNDDTGGILSSAFQEPRPVSAHTTILGGATIIVLMDPVTGGRREMENPTQDAAELEEKVLGYLTYIDVKDPNASTPRTPLEIAPNQKADKANKPKKKKSKKTNKEL